MDPSENELIAHIKDSLMSHEEPYVPGAWENFNDRGRKKPLVFWIGSLSSAAAVLLIATGLYFFIHKTSDNSEIKTAKNSPFKYTGPKPEGYGTPAERHEQSSAAVPAGQRKTVIKAIPDARIAVSAPQSPIRVNVATEISTIPAVTRPVKSVPVASDNPVVHDNPVSSGNPVIAATKEPQEKKNYSFQEFLNNESAVAKESKPAGTAALKENKWEMGVVVAPSFGNTKRLNMGYGISMDYAVSEKVSLGSGIAYNELAASRDITAPSGMMSAPSNIFIAADTEKSLESVETRVVGIDIPFEVKYHFSKTFYANVGVSAFAVLNKRQNNSYVEQRLVERTESSLTAGSKDNFNTVLVAEKVTEKAPESEVSNDKYLGFYNFSFGYKRKISKSNSMSVEPFVKVPMKEVSKENLRLMGTGVRLKFDF
jgi:hypothetical protein